MNEQTRRILSQITQSVPRHLAQTVTREVVDRSGREMAEMAIKSKTLDLTKKKHLQALINRGAFDKKETIVNEQTVKELDRYYETKIALAKKQGLLKENPKDDPFIKERNYRLAKK